MNSSHSDQIIKLEKFVLVVWFYYILKLFTTFLFVLTVKGPVLASKLGKTLTHEHLHMDFSKLYTSPPEHLKKFFDDKITLENIGFIKQYP